MNKFPVSIPALSHHPVEEGPNASTGGIKLVSFSGKEFVIPESHRYGNCRPVTEFHKIRLLGEGAYGTVYQARDTRSNDIVALKKLKIENALTCMPICFSREIKIMNTLKHENLLRLLGVAAGKSFESTYLILEYCPYSLGRLVDAIGGPVLPHPPIKCIMIQLFSGLEFLHKYFVIHRDINVNNILFSDSGILKIADFGCSRHMCEEGMTPDVVALWYRPPELLFGSKTYSYSIDMWSAGCVFAELLLGKPLFRGNSEANMIRHILDGLGSPTEETWPGHSDLPLSQMYDIAEQPHYRLNAYLGQQPASCIILIQNLVLYNPCERYTAAQCVQHHYFAEEPGACSPIHLTETLRKWNSD